jgi:hypothetical protein
VAGVTFDHAGLLRKKRGLVTLTFVALVLIAPSVTYGQVGLTAGTEYGVGGVVQVGSETLNLEVGGGVLPTLVYVTNIGLGDDIFKVYFPGAVGAQVFIGLGGSGSDDKFGLKFGGRYTTLSKFGVGGGVGFKAGEKVRLAAGLMIHPSAEEELRQRINEDEGTNYTEDEFTAPLAFFQPYVSVTLMLF